MTMRKIGSFCPETKKAAAYLHHDTNGGALGYEHQDPLNPTWNVVVLSYLQPPTSFVWRHTSIVTDGNFGDERAHCKSCGEEPHLEDAGGGSPHREPAGIEQDHDLSSIQMPGSSVLLGLVPS